MQLKPRDCTTMRRGRLGGAEIGRALTAERWTPPWRKYFASTAERDALEAYLKAETGHAHVYVEDVMRHDAEQDELVVAGVIKIAKQWEAARQAEPAVAAAKAALGRVEAAEAKADALNPY